MLQVTRWWGEHPEILGKCDWGRRGQWIHFDCVRSQCKEQRHFFKSVTVQVLKTSSLHQYEYSLLPSMMSTQCSQVCSTISVTRCKAGKHPEFEEDLPSPTHTRLPFVTMVVVMRTHTSCHHHRCNLWTKTANINITIIDIHITASASILSFFLATDAMHCTQKTSTTIFSEILLKHSQAFSIASHSTLTISLALHASNISVQYYERSVQQIITFW